MDYYVPFLNRSLDKKKLSALLLWVRFNCGESEALKLVENLKSLGFSTATHFALSLGIDDLAPPKDKNQRVITGEHEIAFARTQWKQGKRTSIELFQQIVDTWHQISENLKDQVIDQFHGLERMNSVYMMAFSGARGNLSQVRQLVSMRGLMANPQGEIVGFPIISNFREGLTMTEYFVSCYGARKGVIDTALRTADAGYLTRRLVDVAHHVVVRNNNCGTTKYISLKSSKKGLSLAVRLVGRVSAETIYAPTKIVDLRSCHTPSPIEGPPSHPYVPLPTPKALASPHPSGVLLPTPAATAITEGVSRGNEGVRMSMTANMSKPVAELDSHQEQHVESTPIAEGDGCGSAPSPEALEQKSNRKGTITQPAKYKFTNKEFLVPFKQVTTKPIIVKNQEITEQIANTIVTFRNKVKVRSPLTCVTPVCQLCYGYALAENRRVSIGEAVGILAAQSLGEPGTQLTLRTFHTGGVFSGDQVNALYAPYEGRVYFSDKLSGDLIRTAQGDIAFLTSKKSLLHIVSKVNDFKVLPSPSLTPKVSMTATPLNSALVASQTPEGVIAVAEGVSDVKALPSIKPKTLLHTTPFGCGYRQRRRTTHPSPKATGVLLAPDVQTSVLSKGSPSLIAVNDSTRYQKVFLKDTNKQQNHNFSVAINTGTIVFVRNYQYVLKNQLLTNFFSQQAKIRVTSEEYIFADFSGQVVHLLPNMNFWVVAGILPPQLLPPLHNSRFFYNNLFYPKSFYTSSPSHPWVIAKGDVMQFPETSAVLIEDKKSGSSILSFQTPPLLCSTVNNNSKAEGDYSHKLNSSISCQEDVAASHTCRRLWRSSHPTPEASGVVLEGATKGYVTPLLTPKVYGTHWRRNAITKGNSYGITYVPTQTPKGVKVLSCSIAEGDGATLTATAIHLQFQKRVFLSSIIKVRFWSSRYTLSNFIMVYCSCIFIHSYLGFAWKLKTENKIKQFHKIISNKQLDSFLHIFPKLDSTQHQLRRTLTIASCLEPHLAFFSVGKKGDISIQKQHDDMRIQMQQMFKHHEIIKVLSKKITRRVSQLRKFLILQSDDAFRVSSNSAFSLSPEALSFLVKPATILPKVMLVTVTSSPYVPSPKAITLRGSSPSPLVMAMIQPSPKATGVLGVSVAFGVGNEGVRDGNTFDVGTYVMATPSHPRVSVMAMPVMVTGRNFSWHNLSKQNLSKNFTHQPIGQIKSSLLPIHHNLKMETGYFVYGQNKCKQKILFKNEAMPCVPLQHQKTLQCYINNNDPVTEGVCVIESLPTPHPSPKATGVVVPLRGKTFRSCSSEAVLLRGKTFRSTTSPITVTTPSVLPSPITHLITPGALINAGQDLYMQIVPYTNTQGCEGDRQNRPTTLLTGYPRVIAKGDMMATAKKMHDFLWKQQQSNRPKQSSKRTKLAKQVFSASESGQVIKIDSNRITLRRAHCYFISSKGSLSVVNREYIKKGNGLFNLRYEKLLTGDIVQGLGKIEELLEYPKLSLNLNFKTCLRRYLTKISLDRAIQWSYADLQIYLVQSIQQVYVDQGCFISDKHLEIIVRQATCFGIILFPGDTGFLHHEVVPIENIEKINKQLINLQTVHSSVPVLTSQEYSSSALLTYGQDRRSCRPRGSSPYPEGVPPHLSGVVIASQAPVAEGDHPSPSATGVKGVKVTTSHAFLPVIKVDWHQNQNATYIASGDNYGYKKNKKMQKAIYYPHLKGITWNSLNSNSILSAASFQETRRVLRDNLVTDKVDFLKGIKERIILGELLEIGTGFLKNRI